MRYIPNVDEMLVAPPYLLGSAPPTYKFQSNIFILDADHAKLDALIDEQLNAALPNGPVKYRVPTSVQRVFVAFFRYERAESVSQADRGWLAYAEAMIGFLTLRETVDGSQPPELMTYLGCVYIDDSAYVGQLQDPHTAPILLGREAYGLPKAPGQIRYEPVENYPKQPKLEIWDTTPVSNRLRLADAICVQPVLASSVPLSPEGTLLPQPRYPGCSRPRRRNLDFDHPLLILAMQFGIGARELKFSESELLPGVENALDVYLPEEGTPAIAWKDLLWRTHLVGLKQFPDPTSSAKAGEPNGQSCYRAIVESPIEEKPEQPLENPEYILRDQILEFPALHKPVDLMASFGIKPTTTLPPRSVLVGQDRMFYQEGVVVFADPSRVRVWNPA